MAGLTGRKPASAGPAPGEKFTLPKAPDKSAAEPAPAKPADAKLPDIASASVPDTLATLKVNPDTGLTPTEVDTRRK